MGIFDFFKPKKATPIIKENNHINNESINLPEPELTVRINNDFATEINPIYTKKLPNNLLPGEIIMLYWASNHIADSDYPGYFKYEYGIDSKISLNTLLNEKYIRDSNNLEKIYLLKNTQLKDILRNNSLKVSGNKKELIERITSNLEINNILELNKINSLSVTEKGQNTLQEYDYIIYAHKNDTKDGTFNPASVLKFVNKIGYVPNNLDIFWSIVQNKEQTALLKNDLIDLRSSWLRMAEQLYKEQRYDEALSMYQNIFIIDLSGMDRDKYINPPSLIFLAPHIVNRISELADFFGFNKEKHYYSFLFSWQSTISLLPFHYLDKDECFKIMDFAINGGSEEEIRKLLKIKFEEIDADLLLKKYGVKYPRYIPD
ncbi:SAP domain-containing protein [Lysinibacillus agricola]|uniref:SAP domain-containing protein n=1 Tax=Lysinibacillus agricola TaxID=2590012 RepID=A0ABX7ALY2_9BACI|nr:MULTISPECIES: SAP domain-containing protein [Lysinibacillus]KOS64665.1 hypothetical protein AN161_01195 [Lysinibacillus sp. FJAT-14222]QQP10466.1 SAP domain-containing protein [Lysinibacillus agricola]